MLLYQLLSMMLGPKTALELWRKTYKKETRGRLDLSDNASNEMLTAQMLLKQVDDKRHGKDANWRSKTQNTLLRCEAKLKADSKRQEAIQKEIAKEAEIQKNRIEEYKKQEAAKAIA